MSKKVICIETNEIFDNAYEAAKHFGISKSSVYEVCGGKYPKTHGKHFCYVDNEHNAILSYPEVPVTEKEITIQKPAKMVAKGKRCNGNSNAVLCISTGQVFTSCLDAAEQVGVANSTMSRACTVFGAKSNGMKFCYVKDINEHLDEIAISIRKAKMYDELMTKETKRKELIAEVKKWEAEIDYLEMEMANLPIRLKEAHEQLEKAKENLMYFV